MRATVRRNRPGDDLAGKRHSRTATLLTAVTLAGILTLISVGAFLVASGGDGDGRLMSSSTTPQPLADHGSRARVLDLRTKKVSKLPPSIARVQADCCYSVSPAGGEIAFIGMVGTSDESEPEGYGILVTDVEGNDVRVVVTDVQGGPNHTPQWSPDGTEILFQRDGALAVVDIATGVIDTITDRPAPYAQPTFSPDGRTILFTRGHRDPAAIWTVPATGGRESVLIEPGANATYSPDGTTIAYTWVGTRPVANTYRGIWLADSDGRDRRPGPARLEGCCAMGFLIGGTQERSRSAWSPDGTKIAASLLNGGPVVVVDLRTEESREVAEAGLPVWLDDTSLIIDGYERVARRDRARV